MSVTDVNVRESFSFGNDPIVIRKYIAGLQKGVVLNVEGYNEEFIRAGHVVVYNKTTEDYKPMPIADGAYGSLPEGYEYCGVVVSTTATKEPFVAVMYNGEVNDIASPYPVDKIATALKTAVPTLVFKHD